MRFSVRIMALLLCGLTCSMPSAQACFCIPVLDPFHWLFGCGCYRGHNPGYAPMMGAPGCCGYQPVSMGFQGPCGYSPSVLPLPAPFTLPARIPAPAIFQQCLDPCGVCSTPMAGPMMPPQPMMPQPWQPTPYLPPQYSVPQYSAPQYMPVAPGPVGGMHPMHGVMMAGTENWSGDCCGEDDGMMAGMYPGMETYPAAPIWNQAGGWAPQAWSPQPSVPGYAWYPQSGPPGVGFPTRSRQASLPPVSYGVFSRPAVARRQFRRLVHQYRRQDMIPAVTVSPIPVNRFRSPQMSMNPAMAPGMHPGGMMVPQGYGAPGFAPMGYGVPMSAQPAYPQPMYSQPMYPAYDFQSSAGVPYPSGWNSAGGDPGMWYGSGPQTMATDIAGDHEDIQSAMIPVVPNAWSGEAAGGGSPFRRASLTGSLSSLSSSYSKSVR